MQSEERPSLHEYNRNAPIKSLKKENISCGRSWKLRPQLKKACLWKSLMTIIILSLEDSHSSINIAFADRGSRTPQASGFLFITAAADAFIYLPQERGSSVLFTCPVFFFILFCPLFVSVRRRQWVRYRGSVRFSCGPRCSTVLCLELRTSRAHYGLIQGLPTQTQGAWNSTVCSAYPGNLHRALTHRDLTPAEALLCTHAHKRQGQKNGHS